MSRGSKICIAILVYLAIVVAVKIWLFPGAPANRAAPVMTQPAAAPAARAGFAPG